MFGLKTQMVSGLAFGVWMVLGGVPSADGQEMECGTMTSAGPDIYYDGQLCPAKGSCDRPQVRDLWYRDPPEAVPMRLRVHMNVFAEADDASDVFINGQKQAIINHFQTRSIELDVNWVRFTGTVYETVDDSTDISNMKRDYNNAPDQQLNVYVTQVGLGLGFRGQAVIPWASIATGEQGGIVIDLDAFGQESTTLTHEIGHCLGLWHTHAGVCPEELVVHGGCAGPTGTFCDLSVPICSCPCYESVERIGCNETGDFCCDTPSTAANFACTDAALPSNPCYPGSWDLTLYHNFMGYAVDAGPPPRCRDSFTQQQTQRMHCWTCKKLQGWIDDTDCNGNGKKDVCDFNRAGGSTDCNANVVHDACDISSGTSQDCNTNNIPDECDLTSGFSQDCNSNNIPDECDISSGTSQDCTGNEIPDECEPDCQPNGVADSCDIDTGTSQDCNSNNIPDECDIASGTSQDCNGNSIPDQCDIDSGTSDDCNSNGNPDDCENTCDPVGDCSADPDCCCVTNPFKPRCRPWDNVCVLCYDDSHCGAGCCCKFNGSCFCGPFACGQQGPQGP